MMLPFRLTEQQVQTMIESNADGILVMDEAGQVLFANPAAVQLLDRPEGEVVGQSLGLPVTRTVAEVEILRADGRHRVADMRVVGIDWDGPAYLASLRDVTERRMAEEALIRERDFCATVLRALRALVFVLGPDGRIEEHNLACEEVLGYAADEFRTLSFRDLLASESEHASLVQALHRLDGRTLECQAVLRARDGSLRHVAGRIASLECGFGRVVVTGVDLTDLHQARRAIEAQQQELERQNQELREARLRAEAASEAKSRFLATMTHEFRTPLTGILGTLELLTLTPLTPDQVQYRDLMALSAEGLLGLVEAILDFSKAEAGMMELVHEPFALVRLLEGLNRIFEPQARAKGLTLRLELDPSVPGEVVGDGERLRQVLVNLLANAVKFTDRGSITLRVEHSWGSRRQAAVSFEVEDTGIGIPADKLALIFQPFIQVEESRTGRLHQGTGLGLAIARHLVERMGGRLEVESLLEAGSRFHFSLHFLRVRRRRHPRSHSPAAGGRPVGRPLRILAVDDNPINLKITSRLLELRKWDVAMAAGGLEALDLLVHQQFDVVLLDVEMPEISGLDVIRMLRHREQETGEHTPVVALTAGCIEGHREQCLAAGMDAYLTKPFTGEQLYGVVAHLTRHEEPEPPTSSALQGR